MSRLIKKYKNRRLYDTEKSKYITVDDLQQYAVENRSFRVEDAASGKDITSATLLQILVEMEAGSTQLFSPNLLLQFIRLSHHPLNQSFKNMLEQMVDNIEEQMKTNPLLLDYPHLTEVWNKQMEQLIKEWQQFFKP